MARSDSQGHEQRQGRDDTPARLKDVAERAGVSVMTVSNVVNGLASVSTATRGKVQKALEELNYQPNFSARSLRRGRSGVIALAVPEIDIPYFAELARFVMEEAASQSWTVLIDQTDGHNDREQLVAEGIRPHLIDGVIFYPDALSSDDIEARRDQTPMVLLGEHGRGADTDHVLVDNAAAARVATDHLIQRGRRRVAAIGAKNGEQPSAGHLRLAGYREALAAAGLTVDSRLIANVNFYHRAEGAAAMERLLEIDPPPDAVFCFSDLLAVGALHTLFTRDLRVPEDVAVVGLDNIDEGQFTNPTLTTMAPDKQQIARHAVGLLGERITGAQRGPVQAFQVDCRLIQRAST